MRPKPDAVSGWFFFNEINAVNKSVLSCGVCIYAVCGRKCGNKTTTAQNSFYALGSCLCYLRRWRRWICACSADLRGCAASVVLNDSACIARHMKIVHKYYQLSKLVLVPNICGELLLIFAALQGFAAIFQAPAKSVCSSQINISIPKLSMSNAI